MKFLALTFTIAALFLIAGIAGDALPARGKLVHMVSFKFKASATKEQIKGVEDSFRALKKKIPQILSYEAGTNISPEGFNKGFTHAFILTFASEKERDAYLVHPDHKEFGKGLGPILAEEGVFVIDFLSKTDPGHFIPIVRREPMIPDVQSCPGQLARIDTPAGFNAPADAGRGGSI